MLTQNISEPILNEAPAHYKVAFFDIDGTIKSHEDGTISRSTRTALTALKNQGILLVAATGRPLSMCDEMKELGIDVFITSNGGYVKHGDNVIHKVPLAPRILREVMEYAKQEQHALSFYTEELSMTAVKHPKILAALEETLSLTDYPFENQRIEEEEVFLLCLFADEEMTKKYIRQFPHLSFRRWHPYILNVLDKDVSKSLAIRSVLDHFGFDPSEAIAFGDGENDIDMLEIAGLGIAMGNGSERLKKAADFVTKPSNEDGIAFALKELGIL